MTQTAISDNDDEEYAAGRERRNEHIEADTEMELNGDEETVHTDEEREGSRMEWTDYTQEWDI